MVVPPPIQTSARMPRRRPAYLLAMWGLIVLWIGCIGSFFSIIAILSSVRDFARAQSSDKQYLLDGQKYESVADIVNWASWSIYIDSLMLIGWLVVSCLGGLLYRYSAKSSL